MDGSSLSLWARVVADVEPLAAAKIRSRAQRKYAALAQANHTDGDAAAEQSFAQALLEFDAKLPHSSSAAKLHKHTASRVAKPVALPPHAHTKPAHSLYAKPAPHHPKATHHAPTHPKASTHAPQANTLDATWNTRLGLGAVAPDIVLDLHEHSLARAHQKLEQGLARAVRSHARLVLLITGRPAREGNPRLAPVSRGVIRASILDWLEGSPHRAHITAIRGAHPRHGGAGALYIILRRSAQRH
jgi:DNA-nicking Smr family endonuclease